VPVAENLLDQQFKVYRPNTVWVSDITYVPTDEGWLYLASRKDLFAGDIVGYAMGERLTISVNPSSEPWPPGVLLRGSFTTPTRAVSIAPTSTGESWTG